MIEGHRWAIEDSFETAKNELGLDAMCQQRKSEPNAGLSLV
jgi:SRSO17 transposase